MNTPDAALAWRTICGTDPSAMDRDQLSDFLAAVGRVRSVCDAAEVRAVRRGRALAEAGSAETPEAILARDTGRSGRGAKAAAEREVVCTAIPEFQDALGVGSMSAGHLDAAALAFKTLGDQPAAEFARSADALIGRAGRVGVDQFARECRELARFLTNQADPQADVDELEQQRRASKVKRGVDRQTGLHNTLLSLDPLRDAKVWKVINAELGAQRQRNQRDSIRDIGWNELQVNAVVQAITNVGTGGSATRVPEVSVHVDWLTLVGAARSTGLCETESGVPLPVATVRRLCCDAEVIPVVFGGAGEVLDHGRSRRTVSRSQRRALAAMHRTCAHPDCTIGFDACKIHHVKWWWKHHGPTDVDNLLPLCERHHQLVHDGGWHLTMTADRIATWKRPDGTVHHQGATIDRPSSARGSPTGAFSDHPTTTDPRPADVPLRL